ncbi:MAG TPA: hypothetical protein VGN57_07870 [Pirellulaceae bacterium]|jgi:hypothetical protein|nr:hypothetical protein [Pirellulaceae bacterium]
MRFLARNSGRTYGSGAFLSAIAVVCLATTGCFGRNASVEEQSRPTIRQVRAEWRAMERNGLLPLLQEPLEPEEDFFARFEEKDLYRSLTHVRETQAAMARLRETAEQIENEETREAFLAADRERDPTRTDALKSLFSRRYEDGVSATDVWVEWDRLFRALGELEQDEWVRGQRLHALEAMLGAHVPSTVPPLLTFLGEEPNPDDPGWRSLITTLPSPATPDGRSIWRFIQAEVEPEGQMARAILERLSYEDSLGGVPHPFADEAGQAKLRRWMESDDPHDFGLKKVVLANAKHLPAPVTEELYELGQQDASPLIQIEAIYLACDRRSTEDRIRRLIEFCGDERYAATARARLHALDKGYRAPRPGDPISTARETVYRNCATLRTEVDATPEELTLLTQGAVQWEEDFEAEEVFVFSYRLPDVAAESRETSEEGEEASAVVSAEEATRGYAVYFLEDAYMYSEDEVQEAGCRTTLDVIAMAHRDYMVYEWGIGDDDPASHSLESVSDYAEELVEKDWRWAELRVPLPTEERAPSSD